MATVLAGIAQFERDMLSERVRSGLAAAKARGRKLGRQTGDRPKSDRLATRSACAYCGGAQLSLDRRDLGLSKIPLSQLLSDPEPMRLPMSKRRNEW
ncbi:recombinase family protein [Sphingomonas prati]|nr:recombinase family protein [Sphingomonas prati]